MPVTNGTRERTGTVAEPWRLRGRSVARRIRVPLGFVFAAFFLVLAQPSPGSLASSLALVLPGLALRAYASGYVKKNAELTTTGPYAYTRNPLYLGSLLLSLGFAAASRSLPILVVLGALFALIYLPTIRSEEEYLQTHFAGFARYAAEVPRLLPRVLPGRRTAARDQPGAGFSVALYSKHREYNALMGAAALYAALLLKPFLERALERHIGH